MIHGKEKISSKSTPGNKAICLKSTPVRITWPEASKERGILIWKAWKLIQMWRTLQRTYGLAAGTGTHGSPLWDPTQRPLCLCAAAPVKPAQWTTCWQLPRTHSQPLCEAIRPGKTRSVPSLTFKLSPVPAALYTAVTASPVSSLSWPRYTSRGHVEE